KAFFSRRAVRVSFRYAPPFRRLRRLQSEPVEATPKATMLCKFFTAVLCILSATFAVLQSVRAVDPKEVPLFSTTYAPCPDGPPLPITCDPKHPWPTCPPQSYCYATNSVDFGPYYCCPVSSGPSWRTTAHFYSSVQPMPYDLPNVMTETAHWPASAGTPPLKSRK
ncbi:hypothetical protein Angca_009580, partial [Angiostrongylus cantonensis]